jgi:hypothetical protein
VAHDVGRLIIVAGVILVAIGLLLVFFDRIPLVGKLPGDIHIRRGNFQLYVPLATSIALSIVATLVFWIVSRLLRK